MGQGILETCEHPHFFDLQLFNLAFEGDQVLLSLVGLVGQFGELSAQPLALGNENLFALEQNQRTLILVHVGRLAGFLFHFPISARLVLSSHSTRTVSEVVTLREVFAMFLKRLFNLLGGKLSRWLKAGEARDPEAVYEAALAERMRRYQQLKTAAAGVIYMRNKLDETSEDAHRAATQHW
jgi:hypothetical protein